jgi:hypothetical protein
VELEGFSSVRRMTSIRRYSSRSSNNGACPGTRLGYSPPRTARRYGWNALVCQFRTTTNRVPFQWKR